MMIDSSTIAVAASVLIGLLVAGYYYYENQFKYFQRLGLRNPKPIPILGNMWTMLRHDRMLTEKEWARTCGKFYGIFQGAKPRFVVADNVLLRQICIKDFDVFPNHEKSKLLNAYQRRAIFFTQDDEWKRMRALQTPTFTSGKIKRMYKLLDKCADDLVQCFGEQLDGVQKQQPKGSTKGGEVEVNVMDIYSLFTMDAIASCGYGLKLERASGSTSIKSVASRDEFVAQALRLFEFSWLRSAVVSVVNRDLLSLFGFRLTPERNIEPLVEKVRHIMRVRRRHLAENKKFDDYLQLLMDARLENQMELSEMDTRENHHAGLTHETLLDDQQRMVEAVNRSKSTSFGNNSADNKLIKRSSLSDEDILSSAIFLLVVGHETTALLLVNCTYALAFHPEVQERLRVEIEKIAELDGDTKSRHVFDYESLTSCRYLDAVISETLRALTPVISLDRESKHDYYVEKYKLTIPAGSKLNMAYYAIMNDPDLWPEPHKFRPERFLPGEREKIPAGAYCPFGLGPRHCMGMRFSLTETKLALAKVLLAYEFLPASNTSYPPRPKRHLNLNSPQRPFVTIKLRNS